MTDSFWLNLYIVAHVVGIIPCLFVYFNEHVKSLKTLEVELRPTASQLTVEVSLILFAWPILMPFAYLWMKLHNWHYKAD